MIRCKYKRDGTLGAEYCHHYNNMWDDCEKERCPLKITQNETSVK